jgi:hypothetical protein
VAWVRVGNQTQCDTHDPDGARLWGATAEPCPDCFRSAAVPLVDLSDEKPAAPPEGCIDGAARERSLTSIALFADGIGRELAAAKDADGKPNEARNIPEAVKMLDLAIRAHRAAGELTRVRERRDYVARLERTVKKLRGGGRN